jgi:hypothetical protein
VPRSRGWKRKRAFATTLRKHYGKWVPTEGRDELRKLAAAEPRLFGSHFVPSEGVYREQWAASADVAAILKCEEGDLKPDSAAEISGLFRVASAKNRHLPPPTVSAGHRAAYGRAPN